MIVEINGYFTGDKHVINIDKVESVSMQRERYGSGSENYELVVLLTNQTFRIEFLSYLDRCEQEYKKLVDALRHRDGELKFHTNKDNL